MLITVQTPETGNLKNTCVLKTIGVIKNNGFALFIIIAVAMTCQSRSLTAAEIEIIGAETTETKTAQTKRIEWFTKEKNSDSNPIYLRLNLGGSQAIMAGKPLPGISYSFKPSVVLGGAVGYNFTSSFSIELMTKYSIGYSYSQKGIFIDPLYDVDFDPQDDGTANHNWTSSVRNFSIIPRLRYQQSLGDSPWFVSGSLGVGLAINTNAPLAGSFQVSKTTGKRIVQMGGAAYEGLAQSLVGTDQDFSQTGSTKTQVAYNAGLGAGYQFMNGMAIALDFDFGNYGKTRWGNEQTYLTRVTVIPDLKGQVLTSYDLTLGLTMRF